MLLEVCVDSLESATNAVYNGADELEVCSNLTEGGLTPSLDLVTQIITMIDVYESFKPILERPKVNVMIRCREGWDFCYNDQEISDMLQQISEYKMLPINRFVFGALTNTQDIEIRICEKILMHAYPIPVTFHRAFDRCNDPFKGIEDLIRLQFSRVLTSGQRDSAAHTESVKLITTLLHKYGDQIEIMPGAGITAENVQIFADLGCSIVHGSFRRERLALFDKIEYVTDSETVRKVKDIISKS